MSQQLELTAMVESCQCGQRLDQALATLFPDYSRSRLKEWILADRVTVNNRIINKPKEKVFGHEQIIIEATFIEEQRFVAQPIPLERVFEDDDILVINKPRNLVVHPGAGNPDGTMLNALLYHYPQLNEIPRAGIVHRLDKDTTGLMVVAKTIPAQTHLVDALQRRAITREYEAIVMGTMAAGGYVDEPMARHPSKRTQMAVHPLGKPAITHYRVREHFRAHTRLRLRLETGRTHQIRVHMAHIKHPLLGDPTYGGRPRPPKGASSALIAVLRGFDRQALHATMLRLTHPITGELMEWSVAIPEDMQVLYQNLRADTEQFKEQLDWL